MFIDDVFQVSTLKALMLGYYDTVINVGQLKKYGDIGLGTFTAINGEMVVLDGVCYQCLGDGTVVVADDNEGTPFATVTFFYSDIVKENASFSSMQELTTILDDLVNENGKNEIYMGKLSVKSDSLTYRSEIAQKMPYIPLLDAMKTDERVYNHDNISGTIVAIYFPEYMQDLNNPGWHLHFISDDKLIGGHLLDISAQNCKIELNKTDGFHMLLPKSTKFNEFDLASNLADEIAQVEGSDI